MKAKSFIRESVFGIAVKTRHIQVAKTRVLKVGAIPLAQFLPAVYLMEKLFGGRRILDGAAFSSLDCLIISVKRGRFVQGVLNMNDVVKEIIASGIPKSCICYVAGAMSGTTIWASDMSSYLSRRPLSKPRQDAIERAALAIRDLLGAMPIKPDVNDYELIAKLVLSRQIAVGYDEGLDRFSA